VTRTITTTTDVIVRTTIYTPQQPVDTYSTTGDSLTTVWAINGQYDTKVDRRVDTTTDTFHWDNSISETAQWLFPTRVDPGQVGFTAASGNVTVDTYIPPEQMISDGEGGYYWSGYYNVHVHVPPVNYGGGDPVYVTYIWENGAAVQPVPVDGNGDATWTIRYDGHSIVVTKGRYDDPNHTVLASFGMGRDTNTASVPMTYTLPDSVTVSTVDQLADNGEGGYASTGYYYVTVHVPPVNLHVGDDKYYVTYSWDNGASIAWNIPVDSNGNATQLVRYDGHGITVTKGAYGSADYVVLASFGLDRTTYNATVQMTLTPAPAVIKMMPGAR